MSPADLPPDELARLERLAATGLLDTEAERDFDDLTRIAAHICQVPIALISLVDEDRQWFKSRVGLEVLETPREMAFCAHAIHAPTALFEVPDATTDPRFRDNPLVTGAPDIRFYAGTPLDLGGGSAIGTLCVIDRTPRQLSQAQRETLQALGRQVVSQIRLRQQQRQLERQHQRLGEALQRAEAAANAKTTFLANTSHEIRTPLHGVVGAIDLIAAQSASTEVRELTDMAQRSADVLFTLVNDVLDAAKIDAERMTVEQVPTDPDSVLDDVANLFRSRAAAKGLQFDIVRCCEPALPIHGDPIRLTQVLSNLVSNAIKFTAQGSITLTLGQQPVGSKVETRFIVHDTGIGMTAAEQAQLFQPFTQANAATRRRYGGTGLGLFISRQLAQLMGGSLTLDSEPGRGSTFTLTLKGEPAALDEAPRAERTPSGFRGHVLVAEDNPVNQRLITLMLDQLGVSWDLAVNGLEAVRMAGADHALVLMDIEMPELDGTQATVHLRRRGYDRPIVPITANTQADDLRAYHALGMQGRLTKPFRLQELADLLARYLPRRADSRGEC